MKTFADAIFQDNNKNKIHRTFSTSHKVCNAINKRFTFGATNSISTTSIFL